MEMLYSVEESAIALWVGESLWGYPFLLSLHVVGLAVIAGIAIMLDLRLLGSFRSLDLESFLPLMKFAWIGFVINAVSGVLLFTSQASYFVTLLPFLLKIGLIFIAAVITGVIQQKIRNASSTRLGLLATVSLVAWLGAIVNGRLIAYF
jgi:hypothetical protein